MDTHILDDVTDFLDRIPDEVSAKVFAHLKSLESGYTEGLKIKVLKGKVKELIVKQYRIIFFTIDNQIYVVDAFRKQSNKTPKRIIERAEKIYDSLK